MIKVLEEAIEKVKTLPMQRQRYAAHVLERIASTDDVYRLTDAERLMVREGIPDLDAGGIVSDAEMEPFLAAPSRMKVVYDERARVNNLGRLPDEG